MAQVSRDQFHSHSESAAFFCHRLGINQRALKAYPIVIRSPVVEHEMPTILGQAKRESRSNGAPTTNSGYYCNASASSDTHEGKTMRGLSRNFDGGPYQQPLSLRCGARTVPWPVASHLTHRAWGAGKKSNQLGLQQVFALSRNPMDTRCLAVMAVAARRDTSYPYKSKMDSPPTVTPSDHRTPPLVDQLHTSHRIRRSVAFASFDYGD